MITALEADRRIHSLPPSDLTILDGHLMVAAHLLLELRETLLTHEQQHIAALLECELLSACAIVTARVVR